MNSISDFTITQYCCIVDNCGKFYSTRFNLRKHIEIVHLRYKRYKCQQCSKLFASHQNLIEHTHLHSGVKPYSCRDCGKLFRHISSLCLHKRSHKFPHTADKIENLLECKDFKEAF